MQVQRSQPDDGSRSSVVYSSDVLGCGGEGDSVELREHRGAPGGGVGLFGSHNIVLAAEEYYKDRVLEARDVGVKGARGEVV